VDKATILQFVVLIFRQRKKSLVVSLKTSKHVWAIDDASLKVDKATILQLVCFDLSSTKQFASCFVEKIKTCVGDRRCLNK